MSSESDSQSGGEREGIWGVDSVEDRGERVPPIFVCVQLDGKEVAMELDTGASVSLILRVFTTNCGQGGVLIVQLSDFKRMHVNPWK